MDRRQRKTRTAIFAAFTELLAKENYGRITVQEIIDAADVGRTTFYAHFQTKDELLEAMCKELFTHIIRSALDGSHARGLYSDTSAPKSIFCHLLQHLEEDENIIKLLSCESSEIFLRYFKDNLDDLVRNQFIGRKGLETIAIPQEFLINHISGSFVEMVLWWIKGGLGESAEEMDRCFSAVIEPIFRSMENCAEVR